MKKMTLERFIKILTEDHIWVIEKIDGDTLCSNVDATIFIKIYKGEKEIEYTNGKDLFTFSDFDELFEYCKDNGVIDWEGKEGIHVYIDGIGDESFDTIKGAFEYINESVILTINGKERKLK